MLRSCRRRGWLFSLQHRGFKILLIVGTAQILCTTIIYYLIGFGSVDEQNYSQNPLELLFLGNNNRDVVNDFFKSNENISHKETRFLSKYGKSAYQRARTLECKKSILITEQQQADGRLYATGILQGSCPARNLSKSRFIGCFRDNINIPDLDGVKIVEFVKDNSPSRCVEYCFSLGQPYAGLQRGVACSCGGRFGRHGALPHSRCDRPCPGNVTLKCGGNLANSVYTTETGTSLKFVAPRQPSNSTKALTRPARIAFILSLNGRAMRQIGRLLRVIYRPEHYYYIHVDVRLRFLQGELEKMTHGLKNVYVAQGQERFSTIWGGASLLTMLMSSYQYLLKRSDWNWDFVINLSETDFPIRPVDELAMFLGANIETNFILTHIAKTETYLSKQGMLFTFLECEHRMWRLSERSLPRGVRLFGASDWVTLTREFVQFIIEGTAAYDPLLVGLLRFFNYTLLPAESYFHTVLLNSKFCDKVANSNLRVVNWQRTRGCRCQQKAIVDWCGCSPNDLLEKNFNGMQQYAASRSPSYFFARKFEESIDQRILNLIEFELLHTLSENSSLVDYFWFNEFQLDLDGPESGTFLKRRPFYETFSNFALKSLKMTSSKPDCPELQDVGAILSVNSLSIRNTFKGLLVEFTADKYTFQVFMTESDERLAKKREQIISLDTITNHNLEKLFTAWGFRVAAIEIGSDFDLKENVFRNLASLFVTNQTGICVALTWEKVATANEPSPQTTGSQPNTEVTKPGTLSTTTSKGPAVELIVGISAPDGTETTCTVVAHPADEVSCICGEAFKLTQPGLWHVYVRSAGAKYPSVMFGSPLAFVVLPSAIITTSNKRDESSLLFPAFWSLRDMCLVSSSNVNKDLEQCFAPEQAQFFEICTAKSWSSYSADVKSLPFTSL